MIVASLGIMQGRLSPPRDGKIQSFPKNAWQKEFFLAKDIGLSHIEWIFEADEWDRNPLSTASGVREMHEVMQLTSVGVISVCADYFMDIPYLTSGEGMGRELREKLEWLVIQANAIGASYIDLPFVDASAIRDRTDFAMVSDFVRPALRQAEKLGVTLALETSLPPSDLLDLLLHLNHPSVAANYDTGNSASFGYDCIEELGLYGSSIRTVHIKDRKLQGSTVPLGTGCADFRKFFSELAKLDFRGPVVLQAAREEGEVVTAMKNKLFVEQYMMQNSNS